jgi:hypothetical protein
VNRPLSTLVGQGWEVLQYSASPGDSGMQEHCFLLRKGRDHRVLRVRKKMLGGGVTSEEIDV